VDFYIISNNVKLQNLNASSHLGVDCYHGQSNMLCFPFSERFSNQEDCLGLRSQGHEKIGTLNGMITLNFFLLSNLVIT